MGDVMKKKNDKQLCWNCEGSVSRHFSQCPFCGTDVTQPQEATTSFQGFASPFQSAPNQNAIPAPPYAGLSNQDLTVSDEEWNHSFNQKQPPKEEVQEEGEEGEAAPKSELVALFLLLPGVVFFLFGLALVLFSHDGVLSLSWNQQSAYFYFFGAVPLVYLGWRALK